MRCLYKQGARGCFAKTSDLPPIWTPWGYWDSLLLLGGFQTPAPHFLNNARNFIDPSQNRPPWTTGPDGLTPWTTGPDGLTPWTTGPDGLTPWTTGPDGLTPWTTGPDGLPPWTTEATEQSTPWQGLRVAEEEQSLKQEEEESGVVRVKQEPGVVRVKQEPGAVRVKQEPGAVRRVKQEPGAVRVKQEPGAARVKQEPGAARVKQEPGPARVRREAGGARVKREPGPARVRRESSVVRVRPEPDAVRVKQETEPPSSQVDVQAPRPLNPEVDSFRPARVTKRDYAAWDSLRSLGLVDQGEDGWGARMLVLHTPRNRTNRELLDVTEGDFLHVFSDAGGLHRLRVLFTGRHRYYAPGTKVSTLVVGVDNREWEALLLDQAW